MPALRREGVAVGRSEHEAHSPVEGCVSYESKTKRLRRESARCQAADLPIFAVPTREMARTGNPDTSKRAAIRVADHLTHLQADVISAFRKHGKMSARQAENLPEFKDRYAASTIRKRISELAQRHRPIDTALEDRGCAIYDLPSAKSPSQEAA